MSLDELFALPVGVETGRSGSAVCCRLCWGGTGLGPAPPAAGTAGAALGAAGVLHFMASVSKVPWLSTQEVNR